MMYPNTGIRILKRSAPTIERGGKSQSASRRPLKSQGLGEQRTNGDKLRIHLLPDQLGVAIWCDSPASDVEQKNPSLITMTMTSLLKLCGFASPATSSGTKN